MTEPIVPRPEQPSAIDTLFIELPPQPPARRRRRLLGPVIALAIIVILLLVAFFVADALARQYATGLIRDKIVDALKLDPATEVDVDLGDGSILLQAAVGTLDNLSLTIPTLKLGEVSGQATLTATAVPIDLTKPLGTLNIEVTVDEANVQNLSAYLSGATLTSIELTDNVIRIGSEVDILFATVPVAVDLAPSANGGGVSFAPVNILLGSEQISADDLRAIPGIGYVASILLTSRDFCVASYLPQALAISDVRVVGKNLVVSLKGDGTTLSGPGLSTMGTCPTA